MVNNRYVMFQVPGCILCIDILYVIMGPVTSVTLVAEVPGSKGLY